MKNKMTKNTPRHIVIGVFLLLALFWQPATWLFYGFSFVILSVFISDEHDRLTDTEYLKSDTIFQHKNYKPTNNLDINIDWSLIVLSILIAPVNQNIFFTVVGVVMFLFFIGRYNWIEGEYEKEVN